MRETLEDCRRARSNPFRRTIPGRSLAPILVREDALVDFTRSAAEIYNRWRGFQPWPGAYHALPWQKLTLHRLVPAGSTAVAPGEMMVEGSRLFVAAGSSTRLELLEVQMEAKKRLPVADFLRGTAPRPHERLGS